MDGRRVVCEACSREFPSDEGIPLLFWPNEWDPDADDVTAVVRSFYEENPFPNYDDMDSEFALREKAQQSQFAHLLNEQIPFGGRVLEVGCGTGQLCNFLGMRWGRTVFGSDLCLNSLKLGNAFQWQHGIENTAFLQMNLFRPAFRPESFDLVICNGVLHHTSAPSLGFQSIAGLVKRGGLIIVGLYNKYGRLVTDLRRLIFRFTGRRLEFLDARLRRPGLTETRKRTWFRDQYQHPHESKHTMGEVLKWFDHGGFEFVNSVPKATAFDSFSSNEQLFETSAAGTGLDHFISQFGILLNGSDEGGLFMMIGRRS